MIFDLMRTIWAFQLQCILDYPNLDYPNKVVRRKKGPKCSKMAFLPNCSKSAPQILLKFGIKVVINEYYDTMWWFMLAKFCFLSFQGVKWPHNAKKWHNWRGKCHPRLSEYSAYPNAIFGNWVQPVWINEDVL